MPVINHQEIPEIEMRPGIRGQFLASVEHGARGVCLLVIRVAPSAAAPLYKHTVEEAMLIWQEMVSGRVGHERHTVGPQHTVSFPLRHRMPRATAALRWPSCCGLSVSPTHSVMRHTWKARRRSIRLPNVPRDETVWLSIRIASSAAASGSSSAMTRSTSP
jgi:hypothetical protein